VALHRNLSGLASVAYPVKGSKDVASLLVCTRKKVFGLGCGFLVSDMIYGGLQGHLGPLYLTLGANS